MVTNSLRMECIRNQSRNRNCSRYLCMRSACEEQDETVDSSVLKVGVILFTATPHWRRGYLEILSKITLRLSTRFLFLGDSGSRDRQRAAFQAVLGVVWEERRLCGTIQSKMRATRFMQAAEEVEKSI